MVNQFATIVEQPIIGQTINVTTTDSRGTTTVSGVVVAIDSTNIRLAQKVVICKSNITRVEDLATRRPMLETYWMENREVILSLSSGSQFRGFIKNYPSKNTVEIDISYNIYRGITTVAWV